MLCESSCRTEIALGNSEQQARFGLGEWKSRRVPVACLRRCTDSHLRVETRVAIYCCCCAYHTIQEVATDMSSRAPYRGTMSVPDKAVGFLGRDTTTLASVDVLFQRLPK